MRNVEIEVTLTGGETHASVVPSNSPLLRDLYTGLASNQPGVGQQPGELIQLPIDEGRAAISFMSTSVVSVMSRPAVLIQSQPQAVAQDAASSTSPAPPYVCIDDFLTPAENEQLLQYALENEGRFEGSSVLHAPGRDPNESYRRSHVLFAIKDTRWKQVFIERLKLHLPHIAATLGIPNLPFQATEIQLTASNDGDFFKRHADADHNQKAVAPRIVTFVYYLHRMPKPYSGGDLLLYSHEFGGPVTAVPPHNNCLVSFASSRLHEVDLVRCPSRAFEDSRFTVNGWLRSDAMDP